MMEHVVRLLKRAGIVDLEVLLYFYPEKITSYFGDGSPWDVQIHYMGAEADYGTAGAVKHAESRIDDTFLVISADIITDIDLSRAIDRITSYNVCYTKLLRAFRIPSGAGDVRRVSGRSSIRDSYNFV